MFLAPEIIQHGVRWKKHQRRLGSANHDLTQDAM